MKAAFTVTPGQILKVYVGGQGNGLNGGGNGSLPFLPDNYDNDGTGGGGASDIRTINAALSDRIIVAGGGGGSTYEVGTNSFGCADGSSGGGFFSG